VAKGRIARDGDCGGGGSAAEPLPLFGEGAAVGAGWGDTVGRRSPPRFARCPPRRRGGIHFTPIITASVRMKSKSPLFSCGRTKARKAAEPFSNMDFKSRL